MSVHSLIDKYTNSDERPAVPRSQSGPPVLELDKERLEKFQLKTTTAGKQPTGNQPAPLSTIASSGNVNPPLLRLLGPDIAAFPYGETAFVEALRLRAEEERTKQEHIRLEVASKNLEIVNKAIQNDVPPHMIPSMCVGPIPEGTISQRNPAQQASQLPMYMGQRYFPSGDYGNITAGDPANNPGLTVTPGVAGVAQQGYPGQPGHVRQLGTPNITLTTAGAGIHQHSPFLAPSPSFGRNYDTLDNASSVAPINYRFGGGPKVPPPQTRRPLSPAKLGAAAVASLANPITPYRPSQRTLPTHQRHFSMPAESLTSPQRNLDRTRNRNPQNIQLQSPLGATSSIQVRPSPAQPLNKQTRNSQIPSQESMTSHQHIIQFHHWKPENPGETERGSISSESLARGLFSHKRHKSNDMSIDLLLVPQETYLGPPSDPPSSTKREHEADISMDTSDVTITELKDGTAETSQPSIGKFPHDILLSNR